jgi:glycolate oxidase FAD binding subunit
MIEPTTDLPEDLLDGLRPVSVHQPASVAELGELVRRAAAEDQSLYPRGGGTMLDYGLPPTRPGLVVDLRRLDQVIDYPARDMTITVQAGITISRLQALLASEGQRLPVDVPQPEQATLGGAVACNVSGPRRLGFGTLRDYVIGISVVNDRGQEVKAGGRVVKNVAGYDLCKLYTGSLGTLGIITQLTLKVRPRPEAQAMLVTGCTANDLADLLNRLHATSTRPVCIEVLTAASTPPDFQVHVGFEDNRATVEWQVERLQQELLPAYACAVRQDGEAERDFRLLAESTAPAGCVAFKANLLSSAVADYLRQARQSSVGSLQAHAGNGIVLGTLSAETTLEQAAATIGRLREAAVAAQGNLVLIRCPTAWKATLGVWGQPRGDGELMRSIKDQLDPGHRFNPGRFAAGI